MILPINKKWINNISNVTVSDKILQLLQLGNKYNQPYIYIHNNYTYTFDKLKKVFSKRKSNNNRILHL